MSRLSSDTVVKTASIILWSAAWGTVGAGAVVSSLGAGGAIPDWPGTFAYIPFLFPPRYWIPYLLAGCWDIFWAHLHRLLGWLTLLVAFTWCALKWRQLTSWTDRLIVMIPPMAVMGQVILGGLHVYTRSAASAQLLASSAPLVIVAIWFGAFGWPTGRAPGSDRRITAGRWLSACLPMLLAIWIYLQGVVGVQLRHISVTSGPFRFYFWTWTHVLSAVGLGFCAFFLLSGMRRPTTSAHNGNRLHEKSRKLLGAILIFQLVLGLVSWLALYGVPRWFIDFVANWQLALTGKNTFVVAVGSIHSIGGTVALVMAASLAWRTTFLEPETSPKATENIWSGITQSHFSSVVAGVGAFLVGAAASAPLHPPLETIVNGAFGVGMFLFAAAMMALKLRLLIPVKFMQENPGLERPSGILPTIVSILCTFAGFALLGKSLDVLLAAIVAYLAALASSVPRSQGIAVEHGGPWRAPLFDAFASTLPAVVGGLLVDPTNIAFLPLAFLNLCAWQVCFQFMRVNYGFPKRESFEPSRLAAPASGWIAKASLIGAGATTVFGLATVWLIDGGLFFLALVLVLSGSLIWLVAQMGWGGRHQIGTIRFLWGLHGVANYVTWFLLFLPR